MSSAHLLVWNCVFGAALGFSGACVSARDAPRANASRNSTPDVAGSVAGRSSTPEVNPAGGAWARARDGARISIPQIQPKCLAAVGCSAEPYPIPQCTDPVVAVPVDELLAKPPNAGARVTITGELGITDRRVTLLECGSGGAEAPCCNEGRGRLGLLAHERSPAGMARRIRFGSRSSPDAYVCRGDESMMCCPFKGPASLSGSHESNGYVTAARGTWTVGKDYELEDVELCLLRVEPADAGRPLDASARIRP